MQSMYSKLKYFWENEYFHGKVLYDFTIENLLYLYTINI